MDIHTSHKLPWVQPYIRIYIYIYTHTQMHVLHSFDLDQCICTCIFKIRICKCSYIGSNVYNYAHCHIYAIHRC